jgi:hypothetical protein
MTALLAWESADSCPDCGAGLVLLDDGITTAGVECRSCGYLDTWTLTSLDGGER